MGDPKNRILYVGAGGAESAEVSVGPHEVNLNIDMRVLVFVQCAGVRFDPDEP